MTLKELRTKLGLSQFEASMKAKPYVAGINPVKWSILESIDWELIRQLEQVFGEKIDIPAGERHDK